MKTKLMQLADAYEGMSRLLPEDVAKARAALEAEIDRVTAERDALKDVCAKLLANANWRVGGVLTPTSKRSDYQSSGHSIVKTRDLASVRDALGEKS